MGNKSKSLTHSLKKNSSRLYLDQPLSLGQSLEIEGGQGHYLMNVMRLKEGDGFRLFNGRDGEWQALILKAKRGRLMVQVTECLKEQHKQESEGQDADLAYLFSPLKKGRLDYMIQKATELGADHLYPVLTDFTHLERFKEDKISLNAIEAAEQCERLTVPHCYERQRWDDLLAAWSSRPELKDRYLIFCDEAGFQDGVTRTMTEAVQHGLNQIREMNQIRETELNLEAHRAAILIGPEGGFSEREREMIRGLPYAIPVTLGPLILRADTAAVAALSLWQSAFGDWRARG